MTLQAEAIDLNTTADARIDAVDLTDEVCSATRLLRLKCGSAANSVVVRSNSPRPQTQCIHTPIPD